MTHTTREDLVTRAECRPYRCQGDAPEVLGFADTGGRVSKLGATCNVGIMVWRRPASVASGHE